MMHSKERTSMKSVAFLSHERPCELHRMLRLSATSTIAYTPCIYTYIYLNFQMLHPSATCTSPHSGLLLSTKLPSKTLGMRSGSQKASHAGTSSPCMYVYVHVCMYMYITLCGEESCASGYTPHTRPLIQDLVFFMPV